MADQSRTIRLPVHLVEQVNKLSRLKRELHQQSAATRRWPNWPRNPGSRRRGSATCWTTPATRCQLDMPVGSDEEAPLGDFIEDGESTSAEAAVVAGFMHDDIAGCWARWTSASRCVVRMRYGLDDGKPHTLDEIGRVFGISRERVRQIERDSMTKLRIGDRSDALRAYAS